MAEILIDKVGSLGDGMGELDGRTVFVPRTIAGERVIASGKPPRLELDSVVKASPKRVEPVCRHFGTCGGCALQHMNAETQLEWKRAEVAYAFKQAGLDVDVQPCIGSPPGTRRRVTFTAKRADGGVQLGFKERGSESLVSISQCPILVPVLVNNLEKFRQLATTLVRGNEEIQLYVQTCDNGIDINFLLDQQPTEDMLAAFVRTFAKTDFLRAGIDGDVIVENEKPVVRFGDAQVNIPLGGFLQAVQQAEEAMADLVCKHLNGRKHVADLFCGSGTFALRLAKRSKVHAVETETNALDALRSAQAEGLKTVTTEKRDLFDLPLMASELKKYDGLCLDPPRAGAEAQIAEIAKADIRSLAYVSCNPTTLARDASMLVKAGYKIESVTPIDQFVFSPHIEVVALFSKKPEKAKRSIFR